MLIRVSLNVSPQFAENESTLFTGRNWLGPPSMPASQLF